MRTVTPVSALGRLTSHPRFETGLRARFRHSQPTEKRPSQAAKKAGVTRRRRVNGNRNDPTFALNLAPNPIRASSEIASQECHLSLDKSRALHYSRDRR